MYNFFNPDETYSNAIRNKDVGVLRALLTGIVGSDPSFATTEFDEAKEYIDDQSMTINGEKLEITEAYKIQEDEVDIDETEWNEKYFQMNLVWLRDNFNLDTRLLKIKKIGQLVYKNKTTLGKSKAENRKQAVSESISMRKRDSMKKKEQAIRSTGDGHSTDNRLIDKIVKWIKEFGVGMAILAMLAISFISIIIKLAGKN